MEPTAGVSKQDIREQIWNCMESQNLADFPRPVHHRIPNFKGASRAAERFPCLQEFQVARTIKVNPDAPQKNARFFVLDSKKTLLVPTPRLRTGLFNKITPPPGATKDILRKCATSQAREEVVFSAKFAACGMGVLQSRGSSGLSFKATTKSPDGAAQGRPQGLL
ncbi:Methenyltetrahydrofolate Synthase Domain-Containing Protein [Manis pentadactyla]|nr:Methenyltetrahydrofolate Synthase Domain-Containing Protein [Manis pentadactyla]